MSEIELGEDYSRQKRLLSFLIGRKVAPLPEEKDRQEYPMKKANVLSRIFFWWVIPVMNVGYTRTISADDLYKLTQDMTVEHHYRRFRKIEFEHFDHHKRRHRERKCHKRGETLEETGVSEEEDLKDFVVPKWSLLSTMFSTFEVPFLLSVLYAVITLLSMAFTPVVLKKLINFVEYRSLGRNIGIGKGVAYALVTSLLMLLASIAISQFFYYASYVGVLVKGVLTTAILEKSFKLSAYSKHKFTASKITSMITTDLSRTEFGIILQPLLLAIPAALIVSVVILVINIGVSAVIGVVLFLLLMASISAFVKVMYNYRNTGSKLTDARISILREIVDNMKIIKLYSWEVPYLLQISKARTDEMKVVLKISTIRNVIDSVSMTLTALVSMVSFLVLYAFERQTRGAAAIFSSVSLFEILGILVFFLPQALSCSADILSAAKRIGGFLYTEEAKKNDNYSHSEDGSGLDAVTISNGYFEWEVFDDEGDGKKAEENLETVEDKTKDNFPGLKEIELTIKKGEFIAVTGPIGSGKTSLLNAIAGTMNCTSGSVKVDGSMSFCEQPWVQNTTIRENILFGSNFTKRYHDVINCCSLQNDLSILEAGDYTEVGEKGITLSGGQKARINFARAVYADKDVILMDDILSAVDAKVGEHILRNCLLGYLKYKTRILATHQLSLIGEADRIIFVNPDGSIDVGTEDELKDRNSEFDRLMKFASTSIDNDKRVGEETEVNSYDFEIEGREVFEQEVDSIYTFEKDYMRLTQRKTVMNAHSDDEEDSFKEVGSMNASKGKLMQKEERAVNHLKSEVYKTYVKLGVGKLTTLGFLIIFIALVAVSTFCNVFINTWLSFWISHKFKGRSDGFYIGIYVMFNLLFIILLSLEFIVLVLVTNNASKILNIKAVEKVLHSPMSFIDKTPIGRLMNRFTKDTDTLDNQINEQMKLMFFSIAQVIGIVILNIVYLPWVGLVLPVLILVLCCVASYYQASAREIKRVEAVQRSFVFDNFNEVLSGMNTIKTYGANKRFVKLNCELSNNMNEASFLIIASQRFLNMILETAAFVFALIVSLLCVFRVFDINAASVGLLVSYCFQIGGNLSAIVKSTTQVENEMNSVERLCQYALHLPQEGPYKSNNPRELSNWPSAGEISFQDVSMSYRPGLSAVLKHLSFHVKAGEKIGVCGRTGAGKSSILSALYRINELEGGKITIDGVDIANLGLNDLRTKISIIPQDPVLFNGTIRKNLDPFGEHDDERLWGALYRCGAIDRSEMDEVKSQDVSSTKLHKYHLDQVVQSECENFSLGERQLISFSRALVRDTKILVLDEATSSVDYETDKKIQESIASEFGQCTILCIAHRLKTILNYDKILTMEKGELAEFDTPLNLFLAGGIYRHMCDKSHITRSDFP